MISFMRRWSGLASPLAALLILLLVAGCAAIAPRNALPEAAAARIEPAGFHNIRYWGDEAAFDAALPDPEPVGATTVSLTRAEARRQLNLLAISGGAEEGAFGPAGAMPEAGRSSTSSPA